LVSGGKEEALRSRARARARATKEAYLSFIIDRRDPINDQARARDECIDARTADAKPPTPLPLSLSLNPHPNNNKKTQYDDPDDDDYYTRGGQRRDPRFDPFPDEVPWPSVALALFLLCFGALSLTLAWLHWTQAVFGKEQAEIGFTIMGLLTVIPGVVGLGLHGRRAVVFSPPRAQPRHGRRKRSLSRDPPNPPPPTNTNRRLPQLDRPLRLARRRGLPLVGHPVLLLVQHAAGATKRRAPTLVAAPHRHRSPPPLPPFRLLYFSRRQHCALIH
jgi:hypothetical protein